MMHYYKGLYPSFDEQYFYKICKCFPMLNLKKPIRSFSKGTIKQVAFVLALSIHPALLVLDEPVDGLDPVMRRQIWSLIMGEVADRGTTVLVSSHNLRELEDVCDHIRHPKPWPYHIGTLFRQFTEQCHQSAGCL